MSEKLKIELNHIPSALARGVKAELEKLVYKKSDISKLSDRIIFLEGRLSSHIITIDDDWQLLRLREIISLRKIRMLKQYCS